MKISRSSEGSWFHIHFDYDTTAVLDDKRKRSSRLDDRGCTNDQAQVSPIQLVIDMTQELGIEALTKPDHVGAKKLVTVRAPRGDLYRFMKSVPIVARDAFDRPYVPVHLVNSL